MYTLDIRLLASNQTESGWEKQQKSEINIESSQPAGANATTCNSIDFQRLLFAYFFSAKTNIKMKFDVRAMQKIGRIWDQRGTIKFGMLRCIVLFRCQRCYSGIWINNTKSHQHLCFDFSPMRPKLQQSMKSGSVVGGFDAMLTRTKFSSSGREKMTVKCSLISFLELL